jgi:hypothetical protein
MALNFVLEDIRPQALTNVLYPFLQCLQLATHKIKMAQLRAAASPYLQFTKAGLIPRRIGERIV